MIPAWPGPAWRLFTSPAARDFIQPGTILVLARAIIVDRLDNLDYFSRLTFVTGALCPAARCRTKHLWAGLATRNKNYWRWHLISFMSTATARVSVDHICARAKVNKGSFYYFFKSKTDLVVAAYEEHWRLKETDYESVFAHTHPPIKRLELWCDYVRATQRRREKRYGHVCGCPCTRAWAANSRRRTKKCECRPSN